MAVYYYMVQERAPFTVGCFGPVSSLAECKALYPTCDDGEITITTREGTRKYDPDCPCSEVTARCYCIQLNMNVMNVNQDVEHEIVL